MTQPPRERKDIRTLSQDERDNLVLAFWKIQQLKPDEDPTGLQSYFNIAGLHGEPFRGAGYGDPKWWGGYCNHGNILFPTWHRAYLLRLENALRKQVPGVTLPYWNEVDNASIYDSGLPSIFTDPHYTFKSGEKKSETIDNPLRSYTYQKAIMDRRQSLPDADYTKPEGVSTCRFPFSGLYGNADLSTTEAFNNVLNNLTVLQTNQYLNENVKTWLADSTYTTSKGTKISAGTASRYAQCMGAPNYTVFSNTTSAQRWNDDNSNTNGFVPVVPLESPHNAMHLAIGGVQIPTQDASSIPNSNGDMGENETAAFDPIFYFHHAFIDMTFWLWQTRQGQTKELAVMDEYPGTNSSDEQGPTPGVAGNTWLTLDSPLAPFMASELPIPPQDTDRLMTSKVWIHKEAGRGCYGRQCANVAFHKDIINIEGIGYTYNISNDTNTALTPPKESAVTSHISVSGINRGAINGSFVISAWAFVGNNAPPVLVGVEPVLSRWHVAGCANCLTHIEAQAYVPLKGWDPDEVNNTSFQFLVHTRTAPRGDAKGRNPPILRIMPRPGLPRSTGLPVRGSQGTSVIGPLITALREKQVTEEGLGK